MSMIKVNYAALEAAETQIKSISASMDEKLAALRGKLQQVVWEGQDQARYAEHQRQWDAAVPVFVCPARRIAGATPVVADDAYGRYQSGGWTWGGRTDYAVNLVAFANRPTCYSAAKFTDGLSNTVFAGEKAYDVAAQGPSWYWDEPVFLGGSKGTSRGAIGLVRDAPGTSNGTFRENWGSAHPAGVQFLYGDGGVHLVGFDADPSLLAALLTPDGGEAVSPP